MAAQLFEGRTLDEALDNASIALGVERQRVSYHVRVEKRGFLGGTKRVVIEASVDETSPMVAPVVEPQVSAMPSSTVPRPSAAARGHRPDPGQGRDRSRRPRSGGRPERDDREARPRRQPAPIPENETDAARNLRRWCDELFDLMRLDVSFAISEETDRLRVQVSGREQSLLLDRDGELLDSIQVLAGKTRFARADDKRIDFDCGDFKERRAEDLGHRARELADIVRKEGGEQLLPAMSPVERRIVHLALQDDAEVETESRGDGFFKRVAIIPRRPAIPPAES